MEGRQIDRIKVAALLACLVIGIFIVAWLLSQRQVNSGREIRVAGAVARPATTRVAATRPKKMEFEKAWKLDEPGDPDREKLLALLQEDPKLATIEEEKFGYSTPLHWAAFAGDIEIARLLLDHGANIDALETTHKGTPLEWAAFAGQVEMVKYLLSRGAMVDDESLVVSVAGTKGRALLTTQPAKYRQINKVLLEARKKAETRKSK